MASFTQQRWAELIETTKASSPSAELGHRAWYLLIAAALSASPSPQLLADFYTHLTQSETQFKDGNSAKDVSLQFRDLLLKQVTLIGAPQVLMALIPLAAAEGSPHEKAQESELSTKWEHVDRSEIHTRGLDTLHSIYGHLAHDRIFPSWGSHTKDVQFMELFTVYGLYLSDFERLTPVETELIVFATISCLGLGTGPALWHLRGLGRLLGARGKDETTPQLRRIKDVLRSLKVAVMGVVEFVGEEYLAKAKLDTWPNVGDVVSILHGWGDDEQEGATPQSLT